MVLSFAAAESDQPRTVVFEVKLNEGIADICVSADWHSD